MTGSRGARAATAAALMAMSSTQAVAVPTTVPLPPKANLASAHLVVDPSGGVGVLYATGGAVVIWRSSDRSQEAVPVPRGAVVEGFALSQGQPMVLIQSDPACSDLSVLIRDQAGQWSTEALAGRARTATLTADSAGTLVVASSGCDGALEVRTRSAPARWTVEQTGVRTLPVGRVSLALGAGGVAVCSIGGEQAAIATRSAAGVWTKLGLPGGALTPGETISALRVGFDPSLRPVSFVVRSPSRRETRRGQRAQILRVASRYDGSIWSQIATVPNAVSLVGSGNAFAILDRSGAVTIESTAFSGLVPGPNTRIAMSAEGILARVQGRSQTPQVVVGL